MVNRKHKVNGKRGTVKCSIATGFSLIELILVVAMISLMAGITVPLYQSLSTTNELDVGVNVIAQDLYRAQSFSRNVVDDKVWGVAVNGQTVTLFRGSNYASRDSAFDDSYLLPGSVGLSGSNQVVFEKLTGLPQTTASFNFTTKTKTSTVTVNSKGMVDY